MNTLTIEQIKTAILVMNSYDQSGVVEFLQFDLDIMETEAAEKWELEKWTEYSLTDCPTLDCFTSYVQEDLHEKMIEQTPHGEEGGDISGYYRWGCKENGGDKEWFATYSPDWNRYDKQYYYIDNCGDNIMVEEIV